MNTKKWKSNNVQLANFELKLTTFRVPVPSSHGCLENEENEENGENEEKGKRGKPVIMNYYNNYHIVPDSE